MRLVAVLAEAKVLRTEIGLRRVEIDDRGDGRTRMLIEFENGTRYSGVGDYEFLGPIYAYANPILDERNETA